MLGFFAGLVSANVIEWCFHKYVLHGLGKNKKSMWAFHWNEHHKACRKHRHTFSMGDFQNFDPSYESFPRTFNSQMKELSALIIGIILALPVCFLSTPAWLGMTVYAVTYYIVHRKSHVDPRWGKKYMPWHWDHHTGKDQDQNWNVVFPLMDWIMRTRVK